MAVFTRKQIEFFIKNVNLRKLYAQLLLWNTFM